MYDCAKSPYPCAPANDQRPPWNHRTPIQFTITFCATSSFGDATAPLHVSSGNTRPDFPDEVPCTGNPGGEQVPRTMREPSVLVQDTFQVGVLVARLQPADQKLALWRNVHFVEILALASDGFCDVQGYLPTHRTWNTYVLPCRAPCCRSEHRASKGRPYVLVH